MTTNLIRLIEEGLGDRAAAVAARVEFDVARWGEGERAACAKLAAARSWGLLVNSLIHDPLVGYGDAVPPAIRAAAKKILTAEDRRVLRAGG
jgi:hypothetical protein